METITNVVNSVSQTASKAIWGEQNETAGNEPVSGLQGKGTATEPYDQGNSADPADPTTRNETAGLEPVSGLEGKGTASEPFDQGNSADATNITSLPIREKSSSTEIPDLSSKPTIPTGDVFNSAAASNASTLGQPSAITSRSDSDSASAGGLLSDTLHQTEGGDSAGVSGTRNLSDTLSKTEGGVEHKNVSAGHEEPPLAGFGGDRSIDPEDESQLPTVVSNVTTGGTLTSSPNQSAGATGTHNLSETLSKTDTPTLSPAATPKSPPTTGLASGDPLSSTTGTGEHHVKSTGTAADGGNIDASRAGAGKEADRIVEERSAHRDAATDNLTKETSPSDDHEKVSKMDKLKEKLHIKKH